MIAPARPTRAPVRSASLAQVQADLGDCRRCGLCRSRSHIVFGAGSSGAELMLIGEAPGAGEGPFVGEVGQLLDRMIASIGWSRETVYLTDAVKCRAPHNREPDESELAACRPFLFGQIRAIRPRVIVTLGRVATRAVTGETDTMSRMHGQRFDIDLGEGTTGMVMPSYHPAFLRRLPAGKVIAWKDLQFTRRLLIESGAHPPKEIP